MNFPSYLRLYTEGILEERIAGISALSSPCMLCPRRCMADRRGGDRGYCGAPSDLLLSSVSPHFGEEKPLVGTKGSGTIFLTHCNLKCVFCQNYDISVGGDGISCSSPGFADVMMDLQNKGCHNINFVTPTHYVHEIVKALPFAIEKGLNIPLVYNTGGYDSLEVVELLEDIFDIYMPDIKFMDPALSLKYCNAGDYPSVVSGVLREMHRQAGDLVIDERGIAQRGLIIRHLVMPSAEKDTRAVIDFIADEISTTSYVNIMDQYYPCGTADGFPEISRRTTSGEFEAAIAYARSRGLIPSAHR